MTAKKGERPEADWQEAGYHMEDAPCEHIAPINDQNDTGYVQGSDPEKWNGDPFEDSAVDENLRNSRSDDLASHESDFWVGPDKAPNYAEIDRGSLHKSTTLKKIRKHMNGSTKLIVVIAVAVVLVTAAVLLVTNLAYRVDTIEVQGNRMLTADEVITISGIKLGDKIQDLKENDIVAHMLREPSVQDRRRYLRRVSVEKELPHRVVLSVAERSPAACFLYNGNTYVIDNHGMILEKYKDAFGAETEGLVRVTGLDVKNATQGRIVALRKSWQLPAFFELMIEIKAIGFTEQIAEINLSGENEIYVTARDGYDVRVGPLSRLHAKLRSFDLVRAELLKMGNAGGTIDVTTPEEPRWLPPTAAK